MPMTISIEDDVKSEFSAICKEIGMSPSTAITIFAKAVIRERGIPFRLTAADVPSVKTQEEHEAICRNYNEHLMRELVQAYEEMKAGSYCTMEQAEREWERRHPEQASL